MSENTITFNTIDKVQRLSVLTGINENELYSSLTSEELQSFCGRIRSAGYPVYFLPVITATAFAAFYHCLQGDYAQAAFPAVASSACALLPTTLGQLNKKLSREVCSLVNERQGHQKRDKIVAGIVDDLIAAQS